MWPKNKISTDLKKKTMHNKTYTAVQCGYSTYTYILILNYILIVLHKSYYLPIFHTCK